MKLPPTLQARWDSLASREKVLVIGAALLVAGALLWWAALAPALQVVRTSGAQHQLLDAQLQSMQVLAAQARTLQAQPKMNYDEALRALEGTARLRLGPSAQLSVAGERATLALRGATADALSQWLAQARINARAVPIEARLTRSTAATASPSAAPSGAGAPPPTSTGGWDGTLILSLPPR